MSMKNKKEQILFNICSTLVKVRFDDAIRECLAIIGRELKLDGAFTLRAGEIPLLFEMKNLWEPERNIAGRSLLLDMSDNPDWNFIRPHGEDGATSICTVSDLDQSDSGEVTIDFFSDIGMSAFASCTMNRGNDFLGMICFVSEEPREWTEEEKELLCAASEYIACEVDVIRTDEIRSTLLKDSEKAIRDANEGSDRFMMNISHEIRTPINAIIGMMSIMRHNLESAEVLGECIDRMEKSAKQMMETISDCVDMTHISNKEIELSKSWIPVGSLLEIVRRAVDPLVAEREQVFDVEYETGMSIFGDEVKLGRILISAISNSSHNAENGTNILLSIKNDRVGGKDVVQFRIRDEVAGLDEETVQHIFEPFGGERFHNTFKGTGLGMTISKHLVELMNGTVEFFSDGWGTELVATIPMEIRGVKAGEAEESSMSADESDLVEMYIGRRILIAEDNALMGEILATILGYRGLEADIALNGQEAFDLYASHDPFYYDMILMDIQMPVMDGLEATRSIRQSGQPDAEMIPIVALSANAFDEDVNKAMNAGMNAYLRKPVGDKELFETIGKLVL